VPALRTVSPAPPAPRARVLLYTPALYETGFKQHHVDGEVLALHAHLRAAGHASVLLDAYYRARHAPTLDQALTEHRPLDAVIVHLWTSDAYGPRLATIADELAQARTRHRVPVIGFGPLAASAAGELEAHGAIDHAIGLARDKGLDPKTVGEPVVAALVTDAATHLTGHTPLARLTRDDVPYQPEAVVSVSASRGCRSRCTFCAYNADLGGGWLELPMAAAVADIAHLHRLTGATRFAFADTDFGGTRLDCQRRALDLLDQLRPHRLAGVVKLSINVRSETLTPDTIAVLADAGVDVILIGVESFNPVTLHRLYGKKQNLDHLATVVAAADAAGITTIASYILWHPWQTIDSLRRELSAIQAFGRHRIPQFMARSRLLVIPGTVAETRIRSAGLLDTAPFHRGFRFADPDVAALHAGLTEWFTHHATPVLAGLSENRAGDLVTIAELKIAEWNWLTDALAAASTGLAGAGDE
jgi:hypothetical protein